MSLRRRTVVLTLFGLVSVAGCTGRSVFENDGGVTDDETIKKWWEFESSEPVLSDPDIETQSVAGIEGARRTYSSVIASNEEAERLRLDYLRENVAPVTPDEFASVNFDDEFLLVYGIELPPGYSLRDGEMNVSGDVIDTSVEVRAGATKHGEAVFHNTLELWRQDGGVPSELNIDYTSA